MERLNQWLMLIANLGVLVGIVFLAVEIQQNNELLATEQRIAIADAWVARNNEIGNALMDVATSEELASLLVRSQKNELAGLSETEMIRVRYYELAVIFRLESQLHQWRQGLLDDEYFESGFKPLVLQKFELWEKLGLVETLKPSMKEAFEIAIKDSEN